MNHITFDYGGYYSKNGEDDDIQWHPRKDCVFTIYRLGDAEAFSYAVLVDKIRRKVKTNQSTMLKLSYFAFGINPNRISYILDDDDASGFLSICEHTERRPLLHVEVVEECADEAERSISQTSRALVFDDELAIDAIINEGGNTEYDPSKHSEALNNVSYIQAGNSFKAEVDEYRGAHVVEPGESENVEWDDGIDMAVNQEFESKREVQDLIDRAIQEYCFDVVTVKSDTMLYVLKCRDSNCKWSVRVAKTKNLDRFSVRTYNKKHTCSRVTTSSKSRSKRLSTRRLVASVVQEHYHGQIDTLSAKDLVSFVESKIGVKVSYTTALRGKNLAVSNMCIAGSSSTKEEEKEAPGEWGEEGILTEHVGEERER